MGRESRTDCLNRAVDTLSIVPACPIYLSPLPPRVGWWQRGKRRGKGRGLLFPEGRIEGGEEESVRFAGWIGSPLTVSTNEVVQEGTPGEEEEKGEGSLLSNDQIHASSLVEQKREGVWAYDSLVCPSTH